MQTTLPDLPSKNRILIDWLAFTVQHRSLEEVASYLGMTLSEFSEYKGRYGYKYRLSCGGIHILYDGPYPNSGICVEMSGQGCRDWETIGYPDYDRVFEDAVAGDLHLTRLDIAYDDFEGLIPFDEVLRKSDDLAEVVSVWRAFDIHKTDKGDSVQYGSRQSDCFARCYDKSAERGLSPDHHWIRFETVFKEDLALKVASLIHIKGDIDDSLYWSIVRDKIRFVEPSDDQNKSRWPTCEWWNNLTYNSFDIHLSKDSGDIYNLNNVESHFFNQYNNTMITLLLTRGFDNFVDQLLSGFNDLSPRFKVMCLRYGLSDDKPSISELYKLKEAIYQIRQKEFEYLNPPMKVSDHDESYD